MMISWFAWSTSTSGEAIWFSITIPWSSRSLPSPLGAQQRQRRAGRQENVFGGLRYHRGLAVLGGRFVIAEQGGDDMFADIAS